MPADVNVPPFVRIRADSVVVFLHSDGVTFPPRNIIHPSDEFDQLADFVTMNQHHTHISFILLAQSLGHLRAGMYRWKAKKRVQEEEEEARRLRDGGGGSLTTTPLRESQAPIIIVDGFEQLVDMIAIHEFCVRRRVRHLNVLSPVAAFIDISKNAFFL